MNRVISTRVPARSTCGRVCAAAMLVMLIGLCLVVGGVAFDIVLMRNVGLGTFVLAATIVLATVVVAHLLERRE